MNPHVKEIFVKRTKLFNAMREFFNNAGYFDVETPILQAIPVGAVARPFITIKIHLNSVLAKIKRFIMKSTNIF